MMNNQEFIVHHSSCFSALSIIAMKTCPQCSKTYDEVYEVCPEDGTRLTIVAAKPASTSRLLDNRYDLVEKIGEGGMGSIYKAVHTEMGRTCAIKLLTAISKDNDEASARFKREAKMASRIDNPHAVIIYDFGESSDGTLFLAMEFIDGKPLSKLIKNAGTLPLDRVIHITSQISEGLAAAHALGIVHRDLKPDNIMITSKGGDDCYVKVLDFGIAKTTDEGEGHLTKTGFVLGTPFYMSPEQLLGEKLDARSDIYSLAIIVYEMLSGKLPFEGDNPQAIMMKRVTGQPIPLHKVVPHVSAEVEQVVMEGLTRDPDARIRTVKEFAMALKNAQRGATQAIGNRQTGSVPDGQSVQGTQIWSGSSTNVDSSPAIEGGTIPIQSAATVENTLPTPAVGQQQGRTQPKSFETVEDRTIAPTVTAQAAYQPQQPQAPQPPQAQPTVQEVESTGKRKSSALMAIAGSLVVLAIVGAIIYFVLLRDKSATPGASGTTAAAILVRNAAPGSEIFINDASRGKAAEDGALKISGLEAGNLEVRISHPEYADFTASVTGEAGKEAAIEALMLPLAIQYGGSKMVLVPAGEFVMGNDDTDSEDEKPEHKVALPAFYIDQFEVTNAEYKRFSDATGKTPPPNPAWDSNYFLGKPDHPVLGLTFNQAVEYARWAGKRLPTEQEWEKAASWDPLENRKRMFPWGDTAARGRTNVGTNKPVAVSQLMDDKSPYGVHGMAGNAFEWVDAVYKPYPGNTIPAPEYEQDYGVTRGAAFIDSYKIEDARTTYRNYLQKDFPPGMSTPVGFRCAISADDSRLQQQIRSRGK